jgi:hypothetical protein
MPAPRYRLLPRHSIYTFTGGEDGRPFVRLFRECWKQIPIGARKRILAHWRAPRQKHLPIIEFSNMWFDSTKSFGQVRNNGREVRFSASDFAMLPRAVSKWIVAHELAHVYQKAIGRTPGGRNEDENEDHANSIVQQWGFDDGSKLMFDILRSETGLSIPDASRRLIELGME